MAPQLWCAHALPRTDVYRSIALTSQCGHLSTIIHVLWLFLLPSSRLSRQCCWGASNYQEKLMEEAKIWTSPIICDFSMKWFLYKTPIPLWKSSCESMIHDQITDRWALCLLSLTQAASFSISVSAVAVIQHLELHLILHIPHITTYDQPKTAPVMEVLTLVNGKGVCYEECHLLGCYIVWLL
jgi:hypothetical protein